MAITPYQIYITYAIGVGCIFSYVMFTTIGISTHIQFRGKEVERYSMTALKYSIIIGIVAGITFPIAVPFIFYVNYHIRTRREDYELKFFTKK
jgi:hypothetical protein